MNILQAASLSNTLRRKNWNQWHEFDKATGSLIGTIFKARYTDLTKEDLLAEDWEIPENIYVTGVAGYEKILQAYVYKTEAQEFEITIRHVPKRNVCEK